MITENDLFNLQKAVVYSFKNIPEYSTTFLDELHDTLFQLGGIKVLNYNETSMSVAVDLISEKPVPEIMIAIMNSYTSSLKKCINANYINEGNKILQNILPEIIDVIAPICVTILNMSPDPSSRIFRINLHN